MFVDGSSGTGEVALSEDTAARFMARLREILVGPSDAGRLGRKPFVPPRRAFGLFGGKDAPAPPVAYEPPEAPGFRQMFARDKLTLGLFFAINTYHGDMPDMAGQLRLARRADELGFAALWTRDVPLRDPTFGDVGQIYDPWVWLGLLTGHTHSITLATGSIVLPLNHPINVAKAAASVDNLSGGRLFLGVASGDRAVEFPAYGLDLEQRGALFRESLAYFARLAERFPHIRSQLGEFNHADLIPKPVAGRIPLGITGHCQQDPSWIAANCDAWIMYSNSPAVQAIVLQNWREAVEAFGGTDFKPFAQPLGIDLAEDPDEAPTPLRSGMRLGRNRLIELLEALRQIGVNHVALNFKRGRRPAEDVMEEVGQEVLPSFPRHPVTHTPSPTLT